MLDLLISAATVLVLLMVLFTIVFGIIFLHVYYEQEDLIDKAEKEIDRYNRFATHPNAAREM